MDFNQTTNVKVLEAYNTLDNFKIVEGDKSSDTIYVYFTSNGLYFPNTEECFQEVLTKDKYEWQYNLVNGARKHILMRDVFKQWYIKGVNSKINSIDKIISFLREETQGFKIITIGSSSGGYMATLIGRLLDANKIYCFNGQFDIWDRVTIKENSTLNLLLEKHKEEETLTKYFNIIPFLKAGSAPLFYFSSTFSEWDKEQSLLTNDLSYIFPFFIKSDIHGIPFYKQNLSRVLNSEPNTLKAIASKKQMSQFKFSLKLEGLLNTLKYYRRNNIK